MHENVLINQLSMTINLSDSSYIPSVLVIMGSLLPHQSHKELATVHVSLNETEVVLLENLNQVQHSTLFIFWKSYRFNHFDLLSIICITLVSNSTIDS